MQETISIETHPARWTALWPSLLQTQSNENLQRALRESRAESEIGSERIQYLSNYPPVLWCHQICIQDRTHV